MRSTPLFLSTFLLTGSSPTSNEDVENAAWRLAASVPLSVYEAQGVGGTLVTTTGGHDGPHATTWIARE